MPKPPGSNPAKSLPAPESRCPRCIYYESPGLITSRRAVCNRREYRCDTLRLVAFICTRSAWVSRWLTSRLLSICSRVRVCPELATGLESPGSGTTISPPASSSSRHCETASRTASAAGASRSCPCSNPDDVLGRDGAPDRADFRNRPVHDAWATRANSRTEQCILRNAQRKRATEPSLITPSNGACGTLTGCRQRRIRLSPPGTTSARSS